MKYVIAFGLVIGVVICCITWASNGTRENPLPAQQVAVKPVTVRPIVAKAIAAKPDHRWPYVGYYEAHATYVDRASSPPGIVEAPTELKWFRLYKNGTYRTNKIGGKERVGNYSIDSKTKEVTFRNGWLRSYLNWCNPPSQKASFSHGADTHPLPFIGWDGPNECYTQCSWKRR